MTRRASCADTSERSILRGCASAASTASLVISWKTIRSGLLSPSASARCQAIASPSRSGSAASSVDDAFLTAARRSRICFSLPLISSYCGVKPASTSTPIFDLGRSRTCPMEARTTYSEPRKRASVRALLGDSTMIRRDTSLDFLWGLWRRLYGTGHEASGQGHYGSGKLQRTQPAGDECRREPESEPDLVRVDRLRSHACQYLPQRWAETLEPSAVGRREGVEGRFWDGRAKLGNGIDEIADPQERPDSVADQQVGATALARADRTGHGEHLTAEVGRPAGSAQGAAAFGGLDHDDGVREGRDDAVSLREVVLEGRRPRRLLGGEAAAGGDDPRTQLGVSCRVAHVNAAAEQGAGRAAGGGGARVCCGVDA